MLEGYGDSPDDKRTVALEHVVEVKAVRSSEILDVF